MGSPSTGGQWLHGTHELLLSKFINIAVKGDLRELIISGEPDIQDLISTWNNIFESFLDGMQDKNTKQRVKDMQSLEKMKFEFDLIQLCVRRLKMGRDIGLEHPTWIIDVLREHIRVDGKFNPEDQDAYYRELQVILTRSNKLQQKIGEMEAILKITDVDSKKNEPASFAQFDTLIARVSVYAKFYINRHKIMTSEFMAIYRQMRADEEAIERQLAVAKAPKRERGKNQ